MSRDKEIRADAKLKNLSKEIQEDLWRMRNPEEGGEKVTFEAILVWLESEHGVSSSLGALSGFFSWLRLEKRFERAGSIADQVREELAKGEEYSAEDIERVAQRIFTAEAMDGGDIQSFVALARLRLENRKLDHDARRLVMLEAKVAKQEAAEAAMKAIQSDEKLTPDQQREKLIDKMDEFFGLKKSK